MIIILLPSIVWGGCKTPKINKSFLKPYETKNQTWKINDPYFYDDTRLGLSIKFQTSSENMDFYVYNLGKAKINEKEVEDELRSGVFNMINYYKQYEPKAIHSEPIFLSGNFFKPSVNKLVRSAVFVLVKKPKTNELSMVSMGFDGQCFLKLRYTRQIRDFPNIEEVFNNPTQDKKVLAGIFEFKGLTILLEEQLLNSGYYQ
jgi:hypothetical protein